MNYTPKVNIEAKRKLIDEDRKVREKLVHKLIIWNKIMLVLATEWFIANGVDYGMGAETRKKTILTTNM